MVNEELYSFEREVYLAHQYALFSMKSQSTIGDADLLRHLFFYCSDVTQDFADG